MVDLNETVSIACPYCKYKMPIKIKKYSQAKGVFVTCKGRSCRKVFEIKVENGKQV